MGQCAIMCHHIHSNVISAKYKARRSIEINPLSLSSSLSPQHLASMSLFELPHKREELVESTLILYIWTGPDSLFLFRSAEPSGSAPLRGAAGVELQVEGVERPSRSVSELPRLADTGRQRTGGTGWASGGVNYPGMSV